MQTLARCALVVAVLIPTTWSAFVLRGAESPDLEAARELLEVMGPELAQRATFDFDSEHRLDWHYVPRERPGVMLGALDDRARLALHALLRTALSSRGYLEVTGIVELEGILQALQSRPDRPAAHRDPGLYTLAFHGRPDAHEPWAFRLEGHHLSLNFTYIGAEPVAATPLFLGAQPHTVSSGMRAGLQVLGGRERLGFELVRSLDERQRELAIVPGDAPRDIVLGPGRAKLEGEPLGIRSTDLDAAQRELLLRLVAEFVETLEPGRALDEMTRARAVFDELRFAWIGPIERASRHYYRVQGPHFVLEYDSTSSDGDHVHTVWRDLERDFGRDPLREHHEHGHSHDGR